MCEILNIQKIDDFIVIDCSNYNGAEEFTKATVLQIIDENENIFTTKDFKVEKTRPCFSTGGSPWISLSGVVPENFLRKGNRICFLCFA